MSPSIHAFRVEAKTIRDVVIFYRTDRNFLHASSCLCEVSGTLLVRCMHDKGSYSQ